MGEGGEVESGSQADLLDNEETDVGSPSSRMEITWEDFLLNDSKKV